MENHTRAHATSFVGTKYNDMYTSTSQMLIHFKMSWNLPHACFAVTMSITTMINEIMKDGVQGKQCY